MAARRLTLLTVLALVAGARPASADITAFLGLSPTPDTHSARGLAFGIGLLIVGFEFEYASLSEDELEGSPSLKTGSGNVLLQTPIDLGGVQLYGTIGGGFYRERLIERQETQFATNVGGGAKIRLLGPLRLRADYRIFRLVGDPLNDVYHRFYVGANLTF
jgi:Outer membrane protein beta-barrel domain